jgi:Phosphodiester glycosidase
MKRRISKFFWLSGLASVVMGLVIWLTITAQSPQPSSTVASVAAPMAASVEPAMLRYQVEDLPASRVHLLSIPGNDYRVSFAVTENTMPLASFAQQHQALAALNGGFFDPQNQRSTSYVTVQGQVVADPTQNDRLINNPDLAPYLNQILNRSELRRYQCGSTIQYDIAPHQSAVPANCQLLDALGAGPQLLPELTLQPEGFTDTNAAGTVIRDALGSQQRNARTAIGITANGDLLWVMVAQKPNLSESGLSLPELADWMQRQGAVKAINLDGGSSSSLVYQGQSINGKLDSQGNPISRPVKSAVLLHASLP